MPPNDILTNVQKGLTLFRLLNPGAQSGALSAEQEARLNQIAQALGTTQGQELRRQVTGLDPVREAAFSDPGFLGVSGQGQFGSLQDAFQAAASRRFERAQERGTAKQIEQQLTRSLLAKQLQGLLPKREEPRAVPVTPSLLSAVGTPRFDRELNEFLTENRGRFDQADVIAVMQEHGRRRRFALAQEREERIAQRPSSVEQRVRDTVRLLEQARGGPGTVSNEELQQIIVGAARDLPPVAQEAQRPEGETALQRFNKKFDLGLD